MFISAVLAYVVVVLVVARRTSFLRPASHQDCAFGHSRAMCTAPFRVVRLMSPLCQKGIVAPRLCPCGVSRFHHKSTAATARLRSEWRFSFLTVGLPLLATLVGAGIAVFAVVNGG